MVSEYRLKRSQLLKKSLPVPKEVKESVYNNTLSIIDYLKYNLIDKVPTTCIASMDRYWIEQFSPTQLQNVDISLFEKYKDIIITGTYVDEIEKMIKDGVSLGEIVHRVIAQRMSSSHYRDIELSQPFSEAFKSQYPQLFLDESVDQELRTKYVERKLNLFDIFENYHVFQDKVLSNQTFTYKNNDYIHEFVRKYIPLYQIIGPNYFSSISSLLESNNPYNLIDNIQTGNITLEQLAQITALYPDLIDLGNLFYNHADQLKAIGLDNLVKLGLTIDRVDDYFISVVETFGIDNIMRFNEEHNQYFSNNIDIFKTISHDYLMYDINTHNPNTKIKFSDNFTYEQFQEAICRMIINGPTNFNSHGSIFKITDGPFCDQHPELFISSDAPEELQDLFYNRKLNLKILYDHPEYVSYIRGIDVRLLSIESPIKAWHNVDGLYNLEKYLQNTFGNDLALDILLTYGRYLDQMVLKGVRRDIHVSTQDDQSSITRAIEDQIAVSIIDNSIPYDENMPAGFKTRYPRLFLPANAPQELKDQFYNRGQILEMLRNNPEYMQYVQNIDVELFTSNLPIYTKNSKSMSSYENLGNFVNYYKQIYSSEELLKIILTYGKYFELMATKKAYYNLDTSEINSLDDLVLKLEDIIYQSILKDGIIYHEDLPDSFKNRYPNLFLSKEIPQHIKDKFYNREFSIEDFTKSDNIELLKYFEGKDIILGFGNKYNFIQGIFQNDLDDNLKKIRIILVYEKIKDDELKNIFKEYIIQNGASLETNKIITTADVLYRLSYSNASELLKFRTALAQQLLLSNDPMGNLDKVEDIFLRNNIPSVGKLFLVFQILHPNIGDFQIESSNTISPVLKGKSDRGREALIFADLLKASIGSNNRSIEEYLTNIEKGNQIFLALSTGEVQLENLSPTDQEILQTFVIHLKTLFENTRKGQQEANDIKLSGDINQDLNLLINAFSKDGTLEYNLPDRIVRMFCHFAGFDTFEELNEYFTTKRQSADERNRRLVQAGITLEEGDFIKGIGDITYLKSILQNGSIAAEFLGSNASSNLTPLDIDLSTILNTEATIGDTILVTEASSYGPIWLVFKRDERFAITRKSPLEQDQSIDPNVDETKIEAFFTGAIGNAHYGIRTGVASSEIDYMIVKDYNPNIGLMIAMNGFYIPVVDFVTDELVFSPQDYDQIRAKMAGLSHYGNNEYQCSENLAFPSIEETVDHIIHNEAEVIHQRQLINTVISNAMSNVGLTLKTEIDGDLTEGSIELIDTGSTSRATNLPGKYDFDFLIRLDKKIMTNPERLAEVKENILTALGVTDRSQIIGTGDFRLKSVPVEGSDTPIDIDITFVEKTDKLEYSTEMALEDRLEVIKEQSPAEHQMVIANILLAKEVLKEAEVYKPNRGETPQGGLGGIGIENWILQNGGSFEQAATEFLQVAEGRTFEEFKLLYHVWDFGENHLSTRRNGAPSHDDFVSRNMSSEGYEKMKIVLHLYLEQVRANAPEQDFIR